MRERATAALTTVVVDDEQLACDELSYLLNDFPEVEVVATGSNGLQALDLVQKLEPELVFLDVNMPRKNGQDCLKAIRKSKKLQYLPVIIISTHYDNKMADALYKNGAHFFIKKPDNLPDLKILIREALQLLDEKDKKQPGRNRFVLNRELKMKPDFN